MGEWMVPWRVADLSVWLLLAAACLSFVTDVDGELPRFNPLVGLCFTAVCALTYIYLVAAHFMSDWAMAAPITFTLVVASCVALLFGIRRPSTILPIVCAAIVCFAGGTAAIQLATRYQLALEITGTETAEGCVLARDSVSGHRISSVMELTMGWIIGAHSERVYFIRNEGAFQWDYSRLRPSPLRASNRQSRLEICGPKPIG